MVSGKAGPARVLALLSQKGGAGKTTLAVHLAVALTGDRRVVLVDTDPQGSAASWHRKREAETPELVACAPGDIGATLRTVRAERRPGLIIIDSMPSVASDIASLARAADLVLIPCRPSSVDLEAVGGTVRLVKDARVTAALLLNACPAPRGVAEAAVTTEARRALAQYGLPVLDETVGHRAALSHALAGGWAIQEFEPASAAAKEIRRLARTVETLLWPSRAPT